MMVPIGLDKTLRQVRAPLPADGVRHQQERVLEPRRKCLETVKVGEECGPDISRSLARCHIAAGI